jgi:hypothetical protein
MFTDIGQGIGLCYMVMDTVTGGQESHLPKNYGTHKEYS